MPPNFLDIDLGIAFTIWALISKVLNVLKGPNPQPWTGPTTIMGDSRRLTPPQVDRRDSREQTKYHVSQETPEEKGEM